MRITLPTGFKIYLTFDVDCVVHTDNSFSLKDEFEIIGDIAKRLSQSNIRATWFIRIDAQIETIFGRADYFFHKHKKLLNSLLKAGHELAWHCHSYLHSDNGWQQNTSVSLVAEEVARYAPVARDYEMRISRLGWGFQANEIMDELEHTGFIIDSSAIPRPNYSWEKSVKNWEGTQKKTYYPSVSDYRRPGYPARTLLEMPITVTEVPAPYDKRKVLRYVNLAYHPEIFRCAVENALLDENLDYFMTLTHPYELNNSQKHGLLAFDIFAFEKNLCFLTDISDAEFSTLDNINKIKEKLDHE